MRKLMLWSTLTVALMLAAVVGLYLAYWGLHARFQPQVVADEAEVEQLLEEAGWVSDNGGGAPLYVVGWRDCESCAEYGSEFAYLRSVGVEPRVILIARPDEDGLPRSTAGERSTVAELWVTRDWTLFQRWTATPARNWTAAGIPPADGNAARTGVIEQGRDFQARLETALRASGLTDLSYPLVLWRDPQGTLMACACSDARAWAFVRDSLGSGPRESASGHAPNVEEPVEAAPVQIEVAPPNVSPVPYPDIADQPRPAPPARGPGEDIGPNVVTREPTSEGPVRQPQPRPQTQRPTPRPSTERPPASRPQRPAETRPEPQRPSPPRQPAPRQPTPEPSTDDDTLFY